MERELNHEGELVSQHLTRKKFQLTSGSRRVAELVIDTIMWKSSKEAKLVSEMRVGDNLYSNKGFWISILEDFYSK